MPRLELHALSGTKRAGELARLVEALYKQRRRLVVWVADEGRLQILDDYLWTFRKLSFVPHSVWSDSLGDVEDPVVLLSSPGNPNGAEVLVVGDEPPPEDFAASFQEIHDLIAAGEEGEKRREFWRGFSERHGGGGQEG
jgi:DNA polymerase-3 subunit chi